MLDPTTGSEVSGPSTKDCDRAMRTLLNIIWFLFGGLWLALGYALAGVIFCILIVTNQKNKGYVTKSFL